MIGTFILALISVFVYLVLMVIFTYSDVPTKTQSYIFYLVSLLLPIFGISFFIVSNSNSYFTYTLKDGNLVLRNKYFIFKKEVIINLGAISQVLVIGPDMDTNSDIIPGKKGGRWISLFNDYRAEFVYAPFEVYNEIQERMPVEFKFLKGREVEKLTKEYNRKNKK